MIFEFNMFSNIRVFNFMKNRNIVLAIVVVILLGLFVTYQYTQTKKKDSGADSKQATQEKEAKNQKAEVNGADSNSNKDTDETDNTNNSIVYFYGEECPHCKDVLAYLDKNDIYSKVNFVKKEVWHSKSNGEELRKAALKCGMNPANIGVPFLFSDGKCYMGGPDVIKFFAEKAGINK